MKTIQLTQSLQASQIALGCMRIHALEKQAAANHIASAIDAGITLFDHADIYGQGNSEELFGNVFDKTKRDSIIIQSKCGIRPGYYDFSYDHIMTAVQGSLKRLQTPYLDILLLHRPDALMEGEEVARAFDELHQKGLVRHFGVSNHNPMQIEYLQRYVKQPLIINQLQLSVSHTPMLDSGINVNRLDDGAINRDGSVLEYCRLKNITVQPWSPMLHTKQTGSLVGNSRLRKLNAVLKAIGAEHRISPSAVAIAWLLRHPAKMQPIIGTTRTDRMQDICTAASVQLSREEWYELYRAGGKIIP